MRKRTRKRRVPVPVEVWLGPCPIDLFTGHVGVGVESIHSGSFYEVQPSCFLPPFPPPPLPPSPLELQELLSRVGGQKSTKGKKKKKKKAK